MAYSCKNFRTKKDLKAAVLEGDVECYQPGGIFPLKEGRNVIEGPHSPEPHRWYAEVEIKDGCIRQGTKVK